MYIELHSRSAFSFLEGSSAPEALVEVCRQQGMLAMALLDRDGAYGSPRFHLAAKKAKIKAHIGAEVSFSPQRHRDTEKSKKQIFKGRNGKTDDSSANELHAPHNPCSKKGFSVPLCLCGESRI